MPRLPQPTDVAQPAMNGGDVKTWFWCEIILALWCRRLNHEPTEEENSRGRNLAEKPRLARKAVTDAHDGVEDNSNDGKKRDEDSRLTAVRLERKNTHDGRQNTDGKKYGEEPLAAKDNHADKNSTDAQDSGNNPRTNHVGLAGMLSGHYGAILSRGPVCWLYTPPPPPPPPPPPENPPPPLPPIEELDDDAVQDELTAEENVVSEAAKITALKEGPPAYHVGWV